MEPKIILVTGASSGFGALARAGHTVYAGIRETTGRNAAAVAAAAGYARRVGLADLLSPAGG